MNDPLQTANALESPPQQEIQQELQQLLQRQAQSVQLRSLLPEVVTALHQQQLLRCLLPKNLGGAELPLPEFLDTIGQLAGEDASTAWCVNQGAIAATLSCWLPATTQESLWAEPNVALASGAPVSGSAQWYGDMLRVTGHWMFCSGYHHATHIAGAVKLQDSSQWVMVFVPKAAVEVLDNWQTQGLRATGSVEFSLTEYNVPKPWVASMKQPCTQSQLLFRLPTGQCFALGFAALALGVAQAALNDCVALAQHKTPRNSTGGLKFDADAQRTMGEAQARWRAAKLLVQQTAIEGWQAAQMVGSQDLIPEHVRVNLRLAGTHGLREAAAVMQFAWQIAGTSGIYQNHPLHQRHQDMAVISQHAQARVSHYGWLGRYLFGGQYEAGPLN